MNEIKQGRQFMHCPPYVEAMMSDQKLCDEALGVNGIDEYTVYAIPVGVAK